MNIQEENLKKYLELKLQIQEIESFTNVIISALYNEAQPPTNIELLDTIGILGQQITHLRKLSEKINF